MQATIEVPGRLHTAPVVKSGDGRRPKVLLLSSSLLTDRMLQYTRLLETLADEASVEVWAMSARNPRFGDVWAQTRATVKEFPAIRPYREFPYNFARRLNDFVWDYRLRPPSRLSMARHVRDKTQPLAIRALKLPARGMAALGLEPLLEDRLERLLLSYERSEAAFDELRREPPAVIVTSGPQRSEEPAVVSAAKRLGIPVLAFISSWDNISTKNRLVFKYDGYLLWSEQMRRELNEFYPQSRDVPTYVVGAPQFDVFFQARFRQTRAAFCAAQGLRAGLPIIVYAVGSPNFIRGEYAGALEMAERVARGGLGDVQLIVRPHPIHDNGEMDERLRQLGPRILLQRTAEAGTALVARSQDEQQITEWVNTFRHADVAVNLSSTVTVDAAIFDRPVVNLDYDPEPGQPNQQLVKDVNHLWTHFKPIAESGGVWLANDADEVVAAVKTYLAQPELHREQRRWIAEYVCGYVDGGCGVRLAQAIEDFVRQQARAAK
jgi:hypothetical protein